MKQFQEIKYTILKCQFHHVEAGKLHLMHEQRKADHIRINLEEDVNFRQLTTGLERYHFLHQALPEIDLASVDTGVSFLGKHLKRHCSSHQ